MNSTEDATYQTKGVLCVKTGYWLSSAMSEKQVAMDFGPVPYHPQSKPAIERFDSNLQLVKMKVGLSTALNFGSKQRQKSVKHIYRART
jgi:hypothetical protein